MQRMSSAPLCQKKTDNGTPQYKIRHLCGNGWCINADHLAVGRKTMNDVETSCHSVLMSAESLEEMAGAAKYACHHETKCWA
ncbi:hypothetical protein PG984_002728 [Apiospora sp. TS-2023a]